MTRLYFPADNRSSRRDTAMQAIRKIEKLHGKNNVCVCVISHGTRQVDVYDGPELVKRLKVTRSGAVTELPLA